MAPFSGMWVPIRYERLSEVCSCCGILGHLSRDCAQFYCSDRGFSSPPQYGEWLRFTGKGMVISNLVERENLGVSNREISQNQRLVIEVPPEEDSAIAMELAPRKTQVGIQINEPNEESQQRTSMRLSPAHYSLSGGSNAADKGKGKVVEMARRFRGSTPAFACPWRSKSSRRNLFLVVATVDSDRSSLMGVTNGGGSKLMQLLGFRTVSFGNEFKREMQACNQHLSEQLLSIFKTVPHIPMSMASGNTNFNEDEDLI